MDRVQLETERLLLRPFARDDWQAVHDYGSDPEVVRFLEWGPNTTKETKDFVDKALAFQKERPRTYFEFAVVEKASGKLIGAVGIGCKDQGQAMVGYCYNRNYWGNGYATEACRAVLDFGFTHLKLHRVVALCDAENIGSATVLRRSGMRQEAHFRQDKHIKGQWRDTLLFAILSSEWDSTKNANAITNQSSSRAT